MIAIKKFYRVKLFFSEHVCKNNSKCLFLANQETLKFKASEALTPGVTTKVPNTEIPTVQQKEEMLVDYSVYQELPEAVQQELQSNYDLKFQQQPEKREDWISELPPWSQVDPASLLALPDTMREQVIEAYGNKKNRQHTPESRTTSSDTSSLSQMEGLPYDVNVWNELPLGK